MRFQYNERGEMQSVVNAQNANFIYQRNQPFNFAKIQQNTSQKNFWQIQKISYANTSKNSISDACAFGDAFDSGGDGWMDSWGSGGGGIIGTSESTDESGVSDCYDPFADMGGAGGGGPETCEQCKARQRKIVESDYKSCLWNRGLVSTGAGIVGGATLGAGAGTLVEPGGGTLIGGIAGGLIGGIGGAASGYMSCNNDRDSQLLSVVDKCPVCK